MAELKNEFSWSPSRHRMFESCSRQYYYNYYGSWGGWYDSADELTRLVYRLKKMSTLPQLVGTVVHDAISRVLKAIQSGRDVPFKTAETYATQLLDRHIEDSLEKRWLRSASKHTHLFEHYYGQDVDIDASRARVVENINAFFESEAFAVLQNTPTDQWLSVEALTSFLFNATKLWVALDVAVRQNGGVAIFDWKTGREREADRLQLAVYALYASTVWGVSIPHLQLQDVYLQAGVVSSVRVDAEVLDETRQIICESIAQMRERLDDPNANTASIDAFPMTDNRSTCESCSFKAVCFPDNPTVSPPPKFSSQEKPTQLSLF
ncbi:MAG: PD-(D/E)XK nuclease family protein [Candidatus Latescibacterota bacterium]